MNEPAPTAKSLMKSNIYCLSPESELSEVVSHLRKHHVSFAPVVKEDQGLRKIIGVVSEADCLEHLANELFHGNPRPPRSAATFMTRHPICVEPDTDLFVLASILVSHNIRQVPVVDKADHLLGIVDRHAVLEALSRFYDEVDEEYQHEHFPPDMDRLSDLRLRMTNR